MFKFSDIVDIQGQSECVSEKNISDRKAVTGNTNDKNGIDLASVEDPLSIHRTT